MALLTACTANKPYRELRSLVQSAPSIPELHAVPFFPQEAYQCGPAALAAVLNSAGADVTPAMLVPQVQVAGRRGSFQLELQTATRRQGYLPYVHSSGFPGLLNQLQQGVPTLVLLNLGLSWAPTWHYAVVVGYEAESERVLLRSGRTRLQQLPLRDFARSWAYSDQWFLTVHKPEGIPLGAKPAEYLQSVAGLERVRQWRAAADAYTAAITRWPEQWLAWMGRGNLRYQQDLFAEAESDYRQALALAPQHPAPNHNLAWALLRQGREEEAYRFAEIAARLTNDTAYQSAFEEINRRAAESPVPKADRQTVPAIEPSPAAQPAN